MNEPKKVRMDDSSPSVTLSIGQLRLLVREEVERAIGSNGKAARSPENAHRVYLKVEEAANLSRLALSTIRAYIRQGKLKSQKVGRRVLIKRTDLERFLESNPLGTDEN